MPLDTSQEWRSQNSRTKYPFSESNSESELPLDFITDLRFFYDRQTEEQVFLKEIDFSSGTYTLTFCYVGSEDVAISGSVVQSHGKDKVYIFGEDQESVVIFSTGDSWDDNSWASSWPQTFSATESKIESVAKTSGPKLLNRIVIDGNEQPLTWEKEAVHKFFEGSNLRLSSVVDINGVALGEKKEFIEISAIAGAGDGFADGSDDLVIKTINGIAPASKKGNFKLSATDCIKVNPRVDSSGDFEENSLRIKNDCLPCCGASDYQKVANGMLHRYNKLKDLRDLLQDMLDEAIDLYSGAVAAQGPNITPVARIGTIRMTARKVIISVHNVSSIPIHAIYGVTISGPAAFDGTATPANSSTAAPLMGLDAPGKYNTGYVNSDTDDQITSSMTFKGNLGAITSGNYKDLEFEINDAWEVGTGDIRGENLTFSLQANGYFGDPPILGCKKHIYNATSAPEIDEILCAGGAETSVTRYKITETTAP
jgi:hypothetical protein